ncbi:hypothetical protein NC652_011808 [Populus alba x Populus x berolinensis]|nr:hypothetical protein NC652_011808 [Populus alba x Populus x berolinensis]
MGVLWWRLDRRQLRVYRRGGAIEILCIAEPLRSRSRFRFSIRDREANEPVLEASAPSSSCFRRQK